jgi:hypothetical protein
VHRERAVVPGEPREPVGDKARERVESRHQHSDLFERGSLRHLTRNPIGRGFDLRLNASMFFYIDGAVRSSTPRTAWIGEDYKRLKQVRSNQVTLG